MTITLNIERHLPERYPASRMLAYHLRDPEGISERGGNGTLEKALVCQGMPGLLQLELSRGKVFATWTLNPSVNDDTRGAAMPAPSDTTTLEQVLENMVGRMLGLQQDIDAFEEAFVSHPELGPLVDQQRGLRVAAAATPFEALSWAIIGQQISVQAATAIRRRLIQATGPRLANGLQSHPDARQLATQTAQRLLDVGLSQAKTRTLLTVSQMVTDQTLPLDHWLTRPQPDWPAFREALLAVRGIGPWTADYTLLRGYGWLDGSLHGDVAVRRALARLLGSETPVTAAFTQQWLRPFAPWKALVGAHLWASNNLQA